MSIRRVLILVTFCTLVQILCSGAVSAGAGDGVYRVTMSQPATMGVVTNCSVDGVVLAHGQTNGADLHADGMDLDANGEPGPSLFLNILSDIAWTRQYDAGRGLSGVFSGCFGETAGANGLSGNLFIYFEKRKGQSTIRFIWHFDYYVTHNNTIREHFTLDSERMPFPAWTESDISARVAGIFDLKYFLKVGNTKIANYESLTGGQGRYFEFDLNIEKIPTPGCMPTEIPEQSCSDGVDNDCDALIDNNDPDCGGFCPLGQPGDSCAVNSDCCSSKCKGKPGSKTCN